MDRLSHQQGPIKLLLFSTELLLMNCTISSKNKEYSMHHPLILSFLIVMPISFKWNALPYSGKQVCYSLSLHGSLKNGAKTIMGILGQLRHRISDLAVPNWNFLSSWNSRGQAELSDSSDNLKWSKLIGGVKYTDFPLLGWSEGKQR